MNKVRFTKMHGSGNDYIYINNITYSLNDPEKLSIQWSKPHTGIGSDGLVLIGTSDIADFSMRIFNADGSEAMMCGNASRCIGKYVYDNKLTEKEEITLETLSGIKTLKLKIEAGKVERVTVDMGEPRVEELELTKGKKEEMVEKEIEVEGISYKATAISMGNPHLIIFVNDITTVELDKIGPLLETHPLFPNRTNVEFAQVLNEKEIRMRVWERGSGITQACGTGACATVVAAMLTKRTGDAVTIKMDGGSLDIEWNKETNKIFMTGDAVKVFDGEVEI